jgi:hypothetical protein
LTLGKVKVWTSGALLLVLYYFPSKFCSEDIRTGLKITLSYIGLRKFEHLHTGSLTSLNFISDHRYFLNETLFFVELHNRCCQ